jgi:hypothetical protein
MFGAACLMVTTASGCSSDTTPSVAATTTATATATATTTTTTTTTEACADAAALKESADTLEQVDPREVGKNGVLAALHEVRTRLDAVKASAGGQWEPQVSEVEAALGSLEETVAAVDRGNALSQLPKIRSQADELEQAWNSLEQEIDQSCPVS